jgi:hypothetical protein
MFVIMLFCKGGIVRPEYYRIILIKPAQFIPLTFIYYIQNVLSQ